MATSCGQQHDEFSFEEVISLLDNGYFDNDEEISNEINSLETELQQNSTQQTFKCEVVSCKKIYKTRGGLTRHIRSKHTEMTEEERIKQEEEENQRAANKLHPLHIKKYVSQASTKLFKDLVYPASIREKFLNFSVSSTESIEIFNGYRDLILKFKDDPEQFLSEFRKISKKCDNALKRNLDQISYRLITMEIGVICLKHLTVKKTQDAQEDVTLKSNEHAALQYLAGHVVHKIYLKLRRNKNWKKPEFQQFLQALKAFKIDPNDDHKLVKAKDRGGLWYICKDGEKIFLCAELLFRRKTKAFTKCVNYVSLVDELRKDYRVKSKFDSIMQSAGITVEPDVGKDIIERLLGLYLRIRCHSYAKDVRENQKIKEKTSRKKRSLRTELKKIEKQSDE